MTRSSLAGLGAAVASTLVLLAGGAQGQSPGTVTRGNSAPADPEEALRRQRVAAVLAEVRATDISAMRPLEVKKFTIPEPSVHVMRVKLEEEYKVDGIGTDKVQLTGWIAVRQDEAKPIGKAGGADWRSPFVVNTEFVGLELRGQSDIFGPVEVSLDPTVAAKGAVGDIEIPEGAKAQLRALAARQTDSSGTKSEGAQKDRGNPEDDKKKPEADKKDAKKDELDEATRARLRKESDEIRARLAAPGRKDCRAPVSVIIKMGQLNLQMKTEQAVVWYSHVDTIPPVGHTASVALTPTPLVADGRKVGSLVSGMINFRELVKSVPIK